jgi:transcription elongation GreA/GreB family factor
MSKVADLVKNQPTVVGVGTKVLIEVNGELQSWEIVDVGESDVPNGKISWQAPLIQYILGAKAGDRISCKIMDNNATIVIKQVFLMPRTGSLL